MTTMINVSMLAHAVGVSEEKLLEALGCLDKSDMAEASVELLRTQLHEPSRDKFETAWWAAGSFIEKISL